MSGDAARIAGILGALPGHRDALQALALAGPRGAWIGAGFVRNAVWDALSGRQPDIRDLADLDVVHFTPGASAESDAGMEAALRAARPALPWSVTNQVRMATRNGHAPYAGLAEALAHWPETATAIAARLSGGRIEVLAPLGVADLLALVVRPGPAFTSAPEVPRARMATKGWRARWPALRAIGFGSD